jgi:DNA-binding CsgD family transcriptional regulator
MDTRRIFSRMGTALPSLVRWGMSPDADLVYRTLVSLDSAREGQLAQDLGMAHERVRDAVRELALAGAIRRVSAATQRPPQATGRAVWAARQPSQVLKSLHGSRGRPLVLAVDAPAPEPPPAPSPMETTPMTAVPAPAPRSQATPEPAAGRPDGAGGVEQWLTRPTGYLVGAPPTARRSDDVPPGTRVMLTPRERAIVELLAQGHTDETAARELDLSRRTVGYALGGLMGRLGVDNRFQLGLALGAMRAAAPTPRGIRADEEDGPDAG